MLVGGRFDKIRDYGRGCFLVDDFGDICRILDRLEACEKYTLLRFKNRFAAGYDSRESCGYRDYQVLAAIEGGLIVEIQIIPREMYEVKVSLGASPATGAAGLTGHGAYKEYRAIQEARIRLGKLFHQCV